MPDFWSAASFPGGNMPITYPFAVQTSGSLMVHHSDTCFVDTIDSKRRRYKLYPNFPFSLAGAHAIQAERGSDRKWTFLHPHTLTHTHTNTNVPSRRTLGTFFERSSKTPRGPRRPRTPPAPPATGGA